MSEDLNSIEQFRTQTFLGKFTYFLITLQCPHTPKTLATRHPYKTLYKIYHLVKYFPHTHTQRPCSVVVASETEKSVKQSTVRSSYTRRHRGELMMHEVTNLGEPKPNGRFPPPPSHTDIRQPSTGRSMPTTARNTMTYTPRRAVVLDRLVWSHPPHKQCAPRGHTVLIGEVLIESKRHNKKNRTNSRTL